MKFTLKPFAELIALSQEKLDAALAPVRAMKAKSQARVKVAEIDEKIIGLEAGIQELATKKDIDFDKIADKIDELELLELRKGRFDEIVRQLFPEGA